MLSCFVGHPVGEKLERRKASRHERPLLFDVALVQGAHGLLHPFVRHQPRDAERRGGDARGRDAEASQRRRTGEDVVVGGVDPGPDGTQGGEAVNQARASVCPKGVKGGVRTTGRGRITAIQ